MTGKRADNATQPLLAALEACASAGGGMVYVPPGRFLAGADSHEAELPAFLIDLTEVTNLAFEE